MTTDIAASRAEALALNLPLYEGPPCIRGHAVNVRRTSSGECRQCSIDIGRARRASGDAAFKASEAARYRAAKAEGRWKVAPRRPAEEGRRAALAASQMRAADPEMWLLYLVAMAV